MVRLPPRSTKSDTRFPDTKFFRSNAGWVEGLARRVFEDARNVVDCTIHLSGARVQPHESRIDREQGARNWRKGRAHAVTVANMEISQLRAQPFKELDCQRRDRKSTRLNSSH